MIETGTATAIAIVLAATRATDIGIEIETETIVGIEIGITGGRRADATEGRPDRGVMIT
jgi:hypothetical protein